LCDFFNHDFKVDRLKSLFGQTLRCLDESSFLKLVNLRNLGIHYARNHGYYVKFTPSAPDQPINLIIFSELETLSDSCVVAAFAHEIAHAILDHGDRVSKGLNLSLEDEANELVRSWGLSFELDRIYEHLKMRKGGNENGTK
jgi:hypothetical protein